MRNIMLIGFMGTGKSTVAAYMNQAYGMEVVEMDDVLAEREQMTIPEIFDKYGEEYFRNRETELVQELQKDENKIVSCGGGVVLREQNVEEMKKAGVIVLLTALPETILDRVREDENRPLLRGNKNVAFIEKMLEDRGPKYRAAADVIVATDGKDAAAICREIMEKVQEEV